MSSFRLNTLNTMGMLLFTHCPNPTLKRHLWNTRKGLIFQLEKFILFQWDLKKDFRLALLPLITRQLMLNRRWQKLKWLELSRNPANGHFEQKMLNALLKTTNCYLKQQQNKTTLLKASTACQLWRTREHVAGCISKAAAAAGPITEGRGSRLGSLRGSTSAWISSFWLKNPCSPR